MPTYSDAMNKFTKAVMASGDDGDLRQVVRPERYGKPAVFRIPLWGVIRLRIGFGCPWNLDRPRRRSPTGRGRRAVGAEVPLIRKKRGCDAQGFDLCFHLRQLRPTKFVCVTENETNPKVSCGSGALDHGNLPARENVVD
jgi:hypothetical protein